MALAKINEMKLDIEEMKKLLNEAQRTRVKDALQVSFRKMEAELTALKEEEMKKEEETKKESFEDVSVVKAKKEKSNEVCYDTKITNYAWDQSDKFIKLYITLKDVQNLAKENTKCEFTEKSMDLMVSALNGRNYSLLINNLMNPILPDGSYFKVKTDMVLVMLKKDSQQKWSHVTLQEKKDKDRKLPKFDEDDADPSRHLMDLMKQMYEDGDDEMKRNIAKAWTESRDKAAMGGGFDL